MSHYWDFICSQHVISGLGPNNIPASGHKLIPIGITWIGNESCPNVGASYVPNTQFFGWDPTISQHWDIHSSQPKLFLDWEQDLFQLWDFICYQHTTAWLGPNDVPASGKKNWVKKHNFIKLCRKIYKFYYFIYNLIIT